MTLAAFRHIESWIFDLDNTLYPVDRNLLGEVDQRMGAFIARYLGVPAAQARHLQLAYLKQFGTTLSGLMQIHNMDPHDFLDYVHDIDLSKLEPEPDLAKAINRLEGRKFIYTNGSARHAERVAGKLGILDLFDGISDIASGGFVGKPEPDAYAALLRCHDIGAHRAAMFEDMPRNLEVPHALGMTTVLICYDDAGHPAEHDRKRWTETPAHIHHMTDDLVAFLKRIG